MENQAWVPGPLGVLEAMVSQSPQAVAWGIVCHPHPLQEGTMNNKVVTTVTRVWQGLHFNTIRFNFRGVGHSEGQYGETRGEVDDLRAVMAWAAQRQAGLPWWLAGFSFGSYIVFEMAKEARVAGLITIAPPVDRFPFQGETAIDKDTRWGIIQGQEDEVALTASTLSWAEGLARPPKTLILPGAGHFFHGQLLALREAVAILS